jgi:hypothetical protein
MGPVVPAAALAREPAAPPGVALVGDVVRPAAPPAALTPLAPLLLTLGAVIAPVGAEPAGATVDGSVLLHAITMRAALSVTRHHTAVLVALNRFILFTHPLNASIHELRE